MVETGALNQIKQMEKDTNIYVALLRDAIRYTLHIGK